MYYDRPCSRPSVDPHVGRLDRHLRHVYDVMQCFICTICAFGLMMSTICYKRGQRPLVLVVATGLDLDAEPDQRSSPLLTEVLDMQEGKLCFTDNSSEAMHHNSHDLDRRQRRRPRCSSRWLSHENLGLPRGIRNADQAGEVHVPQ